MADIFFPANQVSVEQTTNELRKEIFKTNKTIQHSGNGYMRALNAKSINGATLLILNEAWTINISEQDFKDKMTIGEIIYHSLHLYPDLQKQIDDRKIELEDPMSVVKNRDFFSSIWLQAYLADLRRQIALDKQ